MCSGGADQIGIRFDVTTVLPLVFIRIKTRMARSMGEGRPSHRRAEGMAQQPPLDSISILSESSCAVQARAHDRRSSRADPPRPLPLWHQNPRERVGLHQTVLDIRETQPVACPLFRDLQRPQVPHGSRWH